MRVLRGRKVPQPRAFATLGRVYRVSYRTPGALHRLSWAGAPQRTRNTDSMPVFRDAVVFRVRGPAPQLFWAEDIRALYMFPGFWVSKSSFRSATPPPSSRRTVAVFNAWDHYAKAPDVREAVPDYPRPRVSSMGSAFDIVYLSEKWNGRNGEEDEYQHRFSKSGRVKFYMDSPNPSGIFIRGGRLTVNNRGIVY